MADEFNTGTNWWDSSRTAGASSSSSGLNNSLGSYGWQTKMADNIKAAGATRSSMDSVSSGTSVVFHENSPKLQAMDLQIMGLGLSSQTMEWNQALLRGEKSSESSFRSMLQDHNYHHHQQQQQQETSGIGSSQVHWRDKMFSLDQQSEFSPHGSSSDSTVTGQSLPSSFQMDSTALYGSPSTILQGLLGSDQNQAQQQQQQSSINYQYGAMSTNEQLLPNSWSKVPQFLRNSPPKQQQQQQQQNQLHGQLHFSNNAPFWNPSAGAASMADHHARPGIYPSLQTQFQTGNFEEKPKNVFEVRDTSQQNVFEVRDTSQQNVFEVRDTSTVVKKIGNEPASNKRTRNENPSTMPAFKVRKEKMGDRVTALQQLVSPFGKTDTASVLSEAIEYIKFLHEQVSVLSTPYMKNDQAAIQHQQQQNPEKSKDPEGPKQDLRSRGLCLVPVSSTFPLTHDSPVDFWTPTFGGTFR